MLYIIYVLLTDKGVDECFINKNMDGNYFGNCGTDGTNFISCSAKYVIVIFYRSI